MNRIIVNVEFDEGTFGARIDQLPGCVAVEKSLPKLRKMMDEAVAMHLELSRKYNEKIPVEFTGDFELVYKMEAEGLLVAYGEVFTKPALSRMTGINEKQLWHYTSGIKRPRKQQLMKIEHALHTLGHELITVEL